MDIAIIWIERKFGSIFYIELSSMRKVFSLDLDPTAHIDLVSSENQSNYSNLYLDLIPFLRAKEHILLLGPDIQKYKLQSFLQEEYPKIAKNILQLGTLEHFSESEIFQFINNLFPEQQKVKAR